MSRPSNKNSILVLATLGVYFGLVLVGATPQVLANAAMTREFSVKDEIEVKSDLDTKPDNAEDADVVFPSVDQKVARSVKRFLAQFRAAPACTSILARETVRFDLRALRTFFRPTDRSKISRANTSIRSILTLGNLARAGLDPESAVNA